MAALRAGIAETGSVGGLADTGQGIVIAPAIPPCDRDGRMQGGRRLAAGAADVRICHNCSTFETEGYAERRRQMPMDAREIETLIREGIPDATVEIRDLAGDGNHYAATVISESFRGKSRVQQHQIVYQSLKGQMGGVLHALALQTGVPE
ncbi:BolA family protein [Afipia carboxidovorans OM5]|nr:BolA family protein [Afipia carboxidovorans OM5]